MVKFRSGTVEATGIVIVILLSAIMYVKYINAEIDFFSNVKYWQGDEKVVSLADKEKILVAFKRNCLFYPIVIVGTEILTPETLTCYKKLQISGVSESAFNVGFNHIKERFISYYSKHNKVKNLKEEEKEIINNYLKEIQAESVADKQIKN